VAGPPGETLDCALRIPVSSSKIALYDLPERIHRRDRRAVRWWRRSHAARNAQAVADLTICSAPLPPIARLFFHAALVFDAEKGPFNAPTRSRQRAIEALLAPLEQILQRVRDRAEADLDAQPPTSTDSASGWRASVGISAM